MTPLVAADAKNLCLHTKCGTATIGGDDGLCNAMANCICITEQFALPPAKGTPPCICFNKTFGEKRAAGVESKGGIFDISQVMDDTFWVVYAFCGGWGINKMKGPLIASEFKEICCAGSTRMVAPIEDGIFCSAVSTELCIWSEFQLPPAAGNPKCAICTWRLSKETATAAPKKDTLPPQTIGAPAQNSM